MVDAWDNNLDDLTLTFEKVGDIIFLNLGEVYEMVDFLFMTTVAYGNRSTSPEWQLLFNPTQLIIDFSKLKGIDQMGGEFLLLRENYKTIKGKEVIFCGIDKSLEVIFKDFSEEEYAKFLKFETREQAIEYYLDQKNK